jgi:hypothetical protein
MVDRVREYLRSQRDFERNRLPTARPNKKPQPHPKTTAGIRQTIAVTSRSTVPQSPVQPAAIPTLPTRPRATLDFWPHLDRQGGTAATKGTTGTVDLAEEDHDIVWVRSCRLQASHDRGKKRALPGFLSP